MQIITRSIEPIPTMSLCPSSDQQPDETFPLQIYKTGLRVVLIG